MNRKHFHGLVPLLLVILFTAACGGQSSNGEATAVPSTVQAEATAMFSPLQPPEATAMPSSVQPEATPGPTPGSLSSIAFLEILEVGLGPNGFIGLTNFTSVPAGLEGLYLCQGSDCFELPDRVVAPEETVRIAVGDGKGHVNVVATRATLGELRPPDGEIALYASLRTEEPGEMGDYLQWGSTPHDLTQVAVEAGLWFETSYAPSSQNATRLFRVAETGLWLFE